MLLLAGWLTIPKSGAEFLKLCLTLVCPFESARCCWVAISAVGSESHATLEKALLCMQVYYFRRGTVKLSQGKFKSARNDYIISMDTG